MTQKTCGNCSMTKDVSDFHKRSDIAGYRSICKVCHKTYMSNRFVSKRKKPLLTPEERMASQKAARAKFVASEKGLAHHAAHQARRRATKLQATPSWLSPEQLKQIDDFYELAALLNANIACEGDKFTVDHIIPLNGGAVRGLHVPWNLQIMELKLNSSKGNRLET